MPCFWPDAVRRDVGAPPLRPRTPPPLLRFAQKKGRDRKQRVLKLNTNPETVTEPSHNGKVVGMLTYAELKQTWIEAERDRERTAACTPSRNSWSGWEKSITSTSSEQDAQTDPLTDDQTPDNGTSTSPD